MKSFETRFWEKVDKNGPLHPYDPSLGNCWLWTASTNNTGYGQFNCGGVMKGSHRIAYQLETGEELADGEQVLHSCDNPPCQNHTHLHKGNPAINMREKVERRRARTGVHNGEKNSQAKLTEEQVTQIRQRLGQEKITQTALAREYRVSDATVSYIASGQHWRTT